MKDPSEWKLATPGGIKFSLLEQSGNLGRENASWQMVILIQASDLVALAYECFPTPYTLGTLVVYPRRFYPTGLPALECKNIAIQGFTSGRPLDPFGAVEPAYDPEEYERAFEKYLRVTLSFGPCPSSDGDPDSSNPFTYLEITADSSGEFLADDVNQDKIKWKNSAGTTTDPTKEDLDLQQVVVAPQVEWTCTWPQIPFGFFHDTLVPRMRAAEGKVNDSTIDLFGNAPAETIMFLGYQKRYEYTWREGNSGTSPVQATLRFLEKNFQGKDLETGVTVTVTHNHIWKANRGWQRMLPDGVNPIYASADLRAIFTG